jgi:hypothetical protein
LAKDTPPFISIIFGADMVEEVEENATAAASVREPLPLLYQDFGKTGKDKQGSNGERSAACGRSQTYFGTLDRLFLH